MDWKAFFDGLLVLVLGVLGWVAAKKGFKDAEAPVALAELPKAPIAGATVTTTTFTDDADILALKQLTGELTGLAYAQTEQAEATKALIAVVREVGEKGEEVLEDLSRSLLAVRDELREVRAELRAERR